MEIRLSGTTTRNDSASAESKSKLDYHFGCMEVTAHLIHFAMNVTFSLMMGCIKHGGILNLIFLYLLKQLLFYSYDLDLIVYTVINVLITKDNQESHEKW